MKKFLFLILANLLFLQGIFAKEFVLVGKVIGGGMYFETIAGVVHPLRSTSMTNELMELTGKKIRLLCEIEQETCNPIRYEISPFTDEQNLKAWTLKPIPKYVYRHMTAFNPTVTPDGNKLFWTVLVEGGGKSTQKIWFSETDNYGLWKRGREMGSPLNNDTPSAVISALPGGNELIVFGSFLENDMFEELKVKYNNQKKDLVKTAKSMSDLRIKYSVLKKEYKKQLEKIQNRVPLYKSHKTPDGWSRPKAVDFPEFYNLYRSSDNPLHQVFGGSAFSNNGRVLIYSAKHNDSHGKLDLYVSIQGDDGKFSIGKNLGNSVNTDAEEMAPFLASDDRTLYFSSNGRKGLSVYYSRRVGDGWENWTHPKEISKNLEGVNFFTIPAKGNWAYISRKGELMMASLPNELNPQPVILVKGKVIDEYGQPLSADVHYESLVTYEQKGSTVSDPETGKFSLIVPYGERYGFFAEKQSYLPVHKNIDLRNEQSDYKEIQVVLVLPRIAKGKEITINNLFFESAKYNITKASEPELDRLAKIMKDNSTMKVLIEGHTDNTGNEKENLDLSKARAREVAQYLIQKHSIKDDRLTVVGYGQEKPVVSNDSEQNRSKNRRVVFKIIE
ncbi:MAG: OmpA family protein [Leptospiraceae bacterium]|nr:OmpA family protein [Leptospiraceae bacterium]MCP5499140.1 OmpA family protein [Leptospiraceae bacterium]